MNECLDTILNKAQEPLKSKKVQHSNARNAVLFEAINLIIHMDCESSLLVRACNQLGQFLQNRETNLRYLALESMCLLATSEFSHDAVKKHQDTVINALKVRFDSADHFLRHRPLTHRFRANEMSVFDNEPWTCSTPCAIVPMPKISFKRC